MSKQEIIVTLTLEYDPEKNEDKPANIFLYQFITRLNREWPILEITYKGIKKIFRTKDNDINKIALRKVDSINNEDLPKPPDWLKDRTILPPRKTIKK